MRKFLFLLLLPLLFVGCGDDNGGDDAKKKSDSLIQTVENSELAVLEGYEDAAAGYSTFTANALSQPIYIKDGKLTGTAFRFFRSDAESLSQMGEFPKSTKEFQKAVDIVDDATYWISYSNKGINAQLQLRVCYIDGNKVGIECVVMAVKRVDSTENSNANSSDAHIELANMEMPHADPANIFVSHYATVDGVSTVNYSLEWNAAMKHAQWVAFSFDKSNSKRNVTRSDSFVVDPKLPVEMQVDESYHKSDGYDKGHLCASNDRAYSEETNAQTFYYSNMSPQMSSFNSGIWQRMESELAEWSQLTQRGTYDKVYVAKGGTMNKLLKSYRGTKKANDGIVPTTNADGFTSKGLACPAYYFMAILVEAKGEYNAIGFYVNHRDDITPLDGSNRFSVADIKQYVVSISSLEELTGLDFFCNLPDAVEKEVEETLDIDFWKW